jgi:uncharacterized protein
MAFDPFWLTYPLLGVVVGFFAGLLGVGGGGIMVPMLTSLFLSQGVSRDHVVHLALGTSMAAIVVTSVSSLRAHHAHGAVLWPTVKRITPGILIGTFFGTFVASRVQTAFLAVFFTAFMGFVAVQMLAGLRPQPSRELPGAAGLSLVGLGIGGVSALVAIGGGSLSVPFMTWCNVKMQRAIGTSAAIGLPIALAGTLGYLVNGLGREGMPPYSLGFVYVPALVLIGLTSTLTAPLGAKLAHKLPVATLKRAFAVMLLLLCAKMLYGVFG